LSGGLGCGHTPDPKSSASAADVRKGADGSSDPEKLGEWLLAEQLAPQGTAKDAARAREQLGERLKKRKKDQAPGLISSLAVGL
ncbi:hypothetical protein NL463_29175, partial [Klebsiella pneumoniae]|nr:hypothetical protein [Klebsiella pneumoniae]